MTKHIPASALRSANATAFDPLPSGAESARAGRAPVEETTTLFRAGGEKVEIAVVDFNADGACIATNNYLWRGEKVSISPSWHGPIDAEVCWCKDGKAGLKFIFPEDSSENRIERGDERVSANATVILRRPGRSRFSVDVFDVSPRGCKVELVERPNIGETVQVKFDRLEALDAKVRWVEGQTAGLQFERPFHPAVFDLITRRFGH